MARATTGVTVIGNLSKVQRAIPGLGSGGSRVITKVLKENGEHAVRYMQNVIDTTPSALVPGKDNRNWSGLMRKSVSYEVVNPSKSKYRLRLGWINTMRDYFLWQDTGDPQNDRQWPIRGMMMIFQGYYFAKQGVKNDIEHAKLSRK